MGWDLEYLSVLCSVTGDKVSCSLILGEEVGQVPPFHFIYFRGSHRSKGLPTARDRYIFNWGAGPLWPLDTLGELVEQAVTRALLRN